MATLLQSIAYISRKADGTPNALGKVYTYAAGTLTPLASYTTQAGSVENTNPVILSADGTAQLWVDSGTAYRIIDKTASDVTIRDVDNVSGAQSVSADLASTAAGKGSALVGHIASGTGAVATTVQAKLRQILDAADYIAAPGVSDALDQAGVQAAINEAAVLGGRVRVRKPIRNVWNLSALTIPANVVVDDERNIDIGHTAFYATGGDVENRIHGTSVSGGEGPSFVATNNAATGDRTVSFVGRYGAGIGSTVNQFFHFGVWDGSVWTPDLDWIGNGDFGGTPDFRSRFRLGAAGSLILNPAGTGKNISAASAYSDGYSLVINRPTPPGGGALQYQFGVKDGAIECPQEVQIFGANAIVRFQSAAQANKWSLISDFPSAGQFSLYDHTAGKNAVTHTSGASWAFSDPIYPPQDTKAAQTTCGIYAGTGVPSNANGNNGDFYFRGDTPGTANQRVYVKAAGSWTGIL